MVLRVRGGGGGGAGGAALLLQQILRQIINALSSVFEHVCVVVSPIRMRRNEREGRMMMI